MRDHFFRQALALGLLILAINTNADTVTEQSKLTIYSGVVGAEDILNQQYAAAIEKILREPSENPIFAHNNLCVAYVLSEQLTKAHSACSRALKATYSWRNYGDWFHGSQSTRIRAQYRERALGHLRVLQSVDQTYSVVKE